MAGSRHVPVIRLAPVLGESHRAVCWRAHGVPVDLRDGGSGGPRQL